MIERCEEKKKKKKIKRHRTEISFPALCRSSIVCLAVLGLPGDRIYVTPGSAAGQVQLSLFSFGKLLVGNVFFHDASPFGFWNHHSAKREKCQRKCLGFSASFSGDTYFLLSIYMTSTVSGVCNNSQEIII